MLLVLTVHADFFSLGSGGQTDLITDFWPTAIKFEIEGLALVCVDLFVLISGYFGIRMSVKGISNLLFQVWFWVVAIALLSILIESFKAATFIKLMVLSDGTQWFISAYILLMIISPCLNKFTEYASKQQFISVIISFYIVQTLAGWLIMPIGTWRELGSTSFFGFIGLYLIGSFLRLHVSEKVKLRIGFTRGFSAYVVISTFATAITLSVIYFCKYDVISIDMKWKFMSYISPFVICGALALVLAFANLKFTSVVINHLAKSAFVVYIIHLNPFIVDYYKTMCKALYYNLPIWLWPFALLAMVVCVYLVIALIDQPRIWLWNRIVPLFPTLHTKKETLNISPNR